MTDGPVPGLTAAVAQCNGVERLFSRPGEPSRCWCRFFALTGPEYSALGPAARKAQLKEKFDGGSPAPGVLACFVVAAGHERSGVEGYPVDREQRPKAGPADLYHGTLNLFLRAGFTVASSAVAGRAVVRLSLTGPKGA